MQRVSDRSNEKASVYGLEVLDVRIKRADLPEQNEKAIFQRMQAERERQAKQYRAEGEEEAQKIRSEAEKDKEIILAEAYKIISLSFSASWIMTLRPGMLLPVIKNLWSSTTSPNGGLWTLWKYFKRFRHNAAPSND